MRLLWLVVLSLAGSGCVQDVGYDSLEGTWTSDCVPSVGGKFLKRTLVLAGGDFIEEDRIFDDAACATPYSTQDWAGTFRVSRPREPSSASETQQTRKLDLVT